MTHRHGRGNKRAPRHQHASGAGYLYPFFTVSSAMVGVCLTVIGLIRVVITLGTADTLADDFLAGDALLFLISCLLSYWALRSRSMHRMHRLEKIADGIFIFAMIGMVIICALITYTISVPARPGTG